LQPGSLGYIQAITFKPLGLGVVGIGVVVGSVLVVTEGVEVVAVGIGTG